MRSKIRQVIEKSDLFEGLQPELIDRIASSATKKTLGTGAILFQKGDPADALWGVLSGRIVLGVSTEDGKEMTFNVYGEGDVFGEVGVLDFGPRLEEARATEKSELFRLERKRFLMHLQSSPELCFRVFTLLCAHVRGTTENLEDTALYDLPDRLAKRLILLSTTGASHGLEVNISQSELANMLGVHRQAVNRHLRQFEIDGLVKLHRQKIEILNQTALSGIASPGQTDHHGAWGGDSLLTLKSRLFNASAPAKEIASQPTRHTSGLMAIDAAEYSRSLMTDSAGTLKQIEAGLKAVDRVIEQFGGIIAWHTGDRVLVEFPDAQLAMHAALAIQERVDPTKRKDKTTKSEALFRIGVHHGEVLADDNHVLGNAVNTVIQLTRLSGAGDIAISGAVRDAFANREQLDLQFLGEHELKNVSGTVPVYSARGISVFKMLALRAETLVPRRYRPSAFVAALLILVGGIWFAGDWRGRQSTPLVVSELSIAIMPFTKSKDLAFENISEGIPQEIRTALSTIPGMRVIGRESSNYYRERNASAGEIGKKLEVAWLLRGNLSGSGNDIQATTQLLNTANNQTVREDRYLYSLGELNALGPEVVQNIASALGISADAEAGLRQLAPLTTHPEAHALYLEAQSQLWLGQQRYAIKTIPMLKAAIELDPEFAEAHALLANTYAQLDMLDDGEQYNPQIRQKLAEESLQMAISLKPNSPLVLAVAAQARFNQDDTEGALALAQNALRLDPNNTEALRVQLLVEMKREDRIGAMKTSERWMRLEPLSIIAMNAYRSQLDRASLFEKSLAIAERALALHPDRDNYWIHSWAAHNKLELGDRIGAIESSRKAATLSGAFDLWTGLDHDFEVEDDVVKVLNAHSLVYAERYDEARVVLNAWWDDTNPDINRSSNLDYLINMGELESLAGDYESSIEYFEQAISLLADKEGGLARAEIRYEVLNFSRRSHFPLALLFAYRKTGQHEKADKVAKQWEQLVAEHIADSAKISDQSEYMYLYKRAQFYAIERRFDEALAILRIWVDRQSGIFTYIQWDPFMENMRGNAEFEAIVAEVESELAAIRMEYHARQAKFAKIEEG